MQTVIKVENISKAYQLGTIGTGTISRDLERSWARLRGKEDPFLKIGETNDRATKSESNIVWSLKDINFEVQQGDAVGVIGRNGAGKSTLLKILSRITSPTTGSVKIKGRIASLLEVGTGFHPELSGRENIYLNGAILGMRKAEIKRKFDEIVDFSGVERYIDTPVKRYSSGMYVRLAFAVAAHLESEILVVDEVLAVGDAEFQKKCLDKMGDVSKGEGRTVLFVSHNMLAIKNLCNKGILLSNGTVTYHGDVINCTDIYLNANKTKTKYAFFEKRIITKGKNAFINDVDTLFNINNRVLEITISVFSTANLGLLNLGIGINNNEGFRITTVETINDDHKFSKLAAGDNKISCKLSINLNPGRYWLLFLLESDKQREDYIDDGCIPLDIPEYSIFKKPKYLSSSQGHILTSAAWLQETTK